MTNYIVFKLFLIYKDFSLFAKKNKSGTETIKGNKKEKMITK